MSESYCYTVNNRLFSYQYTRNPIVTNEIASNHLNFQQTKFAGRFHGETGSVYQDSCLCTSKAYFLSHKNTGNFNTLEIKGVFTGYFSIEAKTIDTFPRFSLCSKKAESKFNHFDV